MVNATAAKVETQRLLRYIHGRSFSVEEYDKRLRYKEILNSTNPVCISQLQQAIAASCRACCLLLTARGLAGNVYNHHCDSIYGNVCEVVYNNVDNVHYLLHVRRMMELCMYRLL